MLFVDAMLEPFERPPHHFFLRPTFAVTSVQHLLNRNFGQMLKSFKLREEVTCREEPCLFLEIRLFHVGIDGYFFQF